MLVAAVLALSALPPFGLFRSEFLIVSGGLSDPRDAVAAVLVALAMVSFLGLSWSTTQTMLTAGPADSAPGSRAAPGPAATGGVPAVAKGEVSLWIVVAMALGIVALLVLGVHLPADLSRLLDHAAHELGSPR